MTIENISKAIDDAIGFIITLGFDGYPSFNEIAKIQESIDSISDADIVRECKLLANSSLDLDRKDVLKTCKYIVNFFDNKDLSSFHGHYRDFDLLKSHLREYVKTNKEFLPERVRVSKTDGLFEYDGIDFYINKVLALDDSTRNAARAVYEELKSRGLLRKYQESNLIKFFREENESLLIQFLKKSKGKVMQDLTDFINEEIDDGVIVIPKGHKTGYVI